MKGEKRARAGAGRERPRSRLDDAGFIRARLFRDERSPFARYVDLALGSFSWAKLVRYELLMLFIGPVPGALGLLLRKWLFPCLFRQTGRGVIFGPRLTVRHGERITLGDGVVLDGDCLLDARGAGESGIIIGDRAIVGRGATIQAKVGHIEIGSDCTIGSHSDIVAQGSIVIADRVSIAGKAMIAGGRHVVELEDGAGDRQRFTSGSIRLECNVRVGMGAIVQDGVTVGESAIIAPGSVVFENVPPNTVVWGNPARPVRNRVAAKPAPESQPDRPARAGTPADPGAELIRRKVRDYLRDDLYVEFGDGEMSEADSLVDAGILDSLALVRLSVWIEQEYRLDADLARLEASEIDSVEKIADYIARGTRT